MTEKVTLTKLNQTWMRIDCELDLLYELDSAFQFEIPNARYNPKVKAKVWDGIIHLVSVYKQITYLGLFDQIKAFCKDRGYELVVKTNEVGTPGEVDLKITPEFIVEYVDSLNIHSDKVKLNIRDYQYNAVYHSLKYKRYIIESPTGSGKSAEIFAVVRYLFDQDERILIIVPTVGLVTQMIGDFHDYTSETQWSAVKNCHAVYAGRDKGSHKRIVVSTWQSIYTLSKEYFAQFTAVIVDEVHLAKAQSISGILEKCTNAVYKLGFTGSLDKSLTHKQMLTSLFGGGVKVASTRQLMDRKELSDIKIKTLLLKYTKETCKSVRRFDYPNEIKFLVAHEARNRFIRNLATSLKGNTLLLFTRVETHGQQLYDSIKEKLPDREVYFVAGKTDVEDREEIRHLTEKGTDVILIASVGTMSTGINIKRLHNVIFSSPTKSFIRVIQSIGRGVRLAHDKDKLKLFDIADDLRFGAHKNFTYKHFGLRLQYYSEEQFDYTITEIEIEK